MKFIYMTEEQFTLHWCHAAIAHKKLVDAQLSEIVRYGSWLQALLVQLDDATGDEGIVINFNEGQYQSLYHAGVRADRAFTAAVEANDYDAMRDAAHRLWDLLRDVYNAAPQNLAPDGSETNKP